MTDQQNKAIRKRCEMFGIMGSAVIESTVAQFRPVVKEDGLDLRGGNYVVGWIKKARFVFAEDGHMAMSEIIATRKTFMTQEQEEAIRQLQRNWKMQQPPDFQQAARLDGLPDGYIVGWVGKEGMMIYCGISPEGRISS